MKQGIACYLWKIERSPINEEKLAIIVASTDALTNFRHKANHSAFLCFNVILIIVIKSVPIFIQTIIS